MLRKQQINSHASSKRDHQEQAGCMADALKRKTLFHISSCPLGNVFLRGGLKPVQAVSGAESVLPPVLHLCVPAAGLNFHSADRIHTAAPFSDFAPVPTMSAMTVDHVGAAAETHHQVKEQCVK